MLLFYIVKCKRICSHSHGVVPIQYSTITGILFNNYSIFSQVCIKEFINKNIKYKKVYSYVNDLLKLISHLQMAHKSY